MFHVSRSPKMRALALALPLAALVACDDDNQPFSRVDAGVDAATAGTGGTGLVGGNAGAGDAAAAGGSDGGVAVDGSSDGGSSDGGVPAPTQDIVVIRLTTTGVRDPNFGTGGVARIDLSANDSVYGADLDAQNRIVLFGSRIGEGRTDLDRIVVRLSKDGAIDETFATKGVHTLNIGNLADNPRNGFVQADGKIVMSGYTPQPTGVGAQTANKVVLLRLNSDGMPDATFGFAGVVNSNPFSPLPGAPTPEWGMAEAYGVVAQGDAYVTGGYGRSAPSGTVDVVSFRYSATGAFDPNWGMSGVVKLDLVGQNDRGRHIVALADGRVWIVGTGSKALNDGDALVAAFTATGAPDTTFDATGYKLFDYGRTTDDLSGVAVSANGSLLASVGYSGGGNLDEDAALLILPTAPGMAQVATTIVKTVALSETGNDRLLSVRFDGAGRAVAVGYLVENGDSVMVAARFNPDGMLDATFGTAGVARINLSPAGGTLEQARSVVVQTDGSIVIAGTAER